MIRSLIVDFLNCPLIDAQLPDSTLITARSGYQSRFKKSNVFSFTTVYKQIWNETNRLLFGLCKLEKKNQNDAQNGQNDNFQSKNDNF